MTEKELKRLSRADLLDRLSVYEEPEEQTSTAFYSTGVKTTSSGGFVETKSLTISKTVTSIDDSDGNPTGSYNLELTLSGAQGTQSDPSMLDLVIVIDRSGSMLTGTRMRDARNAATTLVNAIKDNANIDARYGLVTFNGTLYAEDGHTLKYTRLYNWTDSSGTMLSNISNIPNPENSEMTTNYEAALMQVETLLNSKRSGATTAVVFLTDGRPTMRYSDPNNPNTTSWWANHGNGRDGDTANVARCLKAAINKIDDLNMNRFYAVGTGTVANDQNNNLEQLVAATKAGTYTEVLTTTDSTKLSSLFADIAMDITHFFCSDVTVTDKLSHLTPGSTAREQMLVNIPNVSSVKAVVTDSEGNIKYGPAATVETAASSYNAASVNRTIKASYDPATQIMKLDFDDAYVLEPNLTYKIQAVIVPTETAYEQYRHNILNNIGEDGYPDVGEALTGTHQNDFGISSNDDATVTYKYVGNDSASLDYKHPVVQLHPGTLVIKKDVVSTKPLTAEQLEKIKFNIKLTFPAKLDSAAVTINRELGLHDTPKENPQNILDAVAFSYPTTVPKEDGTYTYSYTCTVPYLSPNTQYTVKEISNELTDFDVVSSVNGEIKEKLADLKATGTVAMNGTESVEFRNEYDRSITMLTVSKQVTGNMGDWNKDFNFTASLKNDQGEAISMDGIAYTKYTNSDSIEIGSGKISGDTAAFALKHNEKIVFENVPMKSIATITELMGDSAYDVYINGSSQKSANGVFTAEVPQTEAGLVVAYVNHSEEPINVGVVTDSMPMVILFTLSLAGAAMLLARKRRVE